jgi:hypothetical protein
MAPIDLLLAAVADRHELGTLDYDREYDLPVSKNLPATIGAERDRA